jgi:hypothetical protein
MSAPRLLLVEFLHLEKFQQYRGELFPFLSAYAETQGAAVRWLAFGVSAEQFAADRFVQRFGPRDAAALQRTLNDFRPTHVLSNEHLGDGARALFEARSEVRVATTERGDFDPSRLGTVREWLGLGQADDGFLVDAVEPDFRCELANELATEIRPFVQLLAGPTCTYQRTLTRNPYYARWGERAARRSSGCAFCDLPTNTKYPYGTHALELVMKQLRAAVRTSPSGRPAGTYLVQGIAPFLLLRRFVELLLEEHLAPSEFLFGCRIDEVLRMSETIEQVLPHLAAAGHSIHVHNIGVENFSEAENVRFNKGITAAQVSEAAEHLRRWEANYPETFFFSPYGGFGFITFTPWTCLEDLEVNLRCARETNLAIGELFATSRLILLPGLPITDLAREDGLVVSAFEDPAVAAMVDGGCLNSWDQAEVPWRFAHLDIANIYSLLLRLGSGPSSHVADALALSARRLVEGLPLRERAPLELMPRLVRAARGRPGATPDDLLAWAVREARAESELPLDQCRTDSWLAFAARAQRVLERVASSPSGPMRGFIAECAEAKPHAGECLVVLRRGDERIDLLVRGRDGFETAYLRTERLSLSYRATTPVDTVEKHALVEVVASALERFVVHTSGKQ